tara:strand:- start:395 stop:532 length:138 start_codon:yes stop_codon:yes gene_type:complete
VRNNYLLLRNQIAKNPTPEKWKILDRQENSLMEQLATEMIEENLL